MEKEEYVPLIKLVTDNIHHSVSRTQSFVVCFHGDQNQLDNFENSMDEKFIPNGKNLTIEVPDRTFSFVLNGLKNNKITIDKKFNHLLLRECRDVEIELRAGNISGIDLLKSQNILLRTPLMNYTNIEYSSNGNIFSKMDHSSVINVIGSQNIHFENLSLPVNLFVSRKFTQDGYQEISTASHPTGNYFLCI